jgi:hypothetical protein
MISQLCLCLAYNYNFPRGGIRIYFDNLMLESFKSFSPSELVIEPLTKAWPIRQYEYEMNGGYDFRKLFARYDKYITDNIGKYTFANAYEKFIFYYATATRIYNDTDSDDVIDNNKSGDMFAYTMYGDFTETKNGMICHISDGYIGQLMRYVCLRQRDYEYTSNNVKKTIKRNKHYVWRDAHSNETGINDALMIRSFNESVKTNSTKKKLNLIPCNNAYVMGWHDYAKCPANEQLYYPRSMIAGIVQMTNFTDSSEWLSDEEYYQFVGKGFLLDDNNKVTLKNHRPYQKRNAEGTIVEDYGYGIEEYIFSIIFDDMFAKNNIYYHDYFSHELMFGNDYSGSHSSYSTDHSSQISGYSTNNYQYNNGTGTGRHITKTDDVVMVRNIVRKTYMLLIKYLYAKKILNGKTNYFNVIKKIEELRTTPPSDFNEKAWVGFLLSIFPTKYFMSYTIFNRADKIDNDIDEIIVNTGGVETITVQNYSLQELYNIGISCNAPLMMSGMEWCIYPYLSNDKCMPNTHFSGYYDEYSDSLINGIFRNPIELQLLVKILDIKRHDDYVMYAKLLENNSGVYLETKEKYEQLKNQQQTQ